MKFIRSFPEICASTRCPFSSSTANIVLGNGSTTVPSTSIASRFATGGAGSLSHTECRPGRADTRTRSVSEIGFWGQTGRSRRTGTSVDRGEDLGTVLGDGDGVLEMGREGAVRGAHGPAVSLDVHVPAPEREHRLDREADAGLELGATRAGAVVRDLR